MLYSRATLLLALLFCGTISQQRAGAAEPGHEKPAAGSAAENQPGVVQNTRSEKESFVQPDYTRWTLVSEGMTEKEVLTLLGKPLARSEHTPEFRRYSVRFREEETKLVPYVWTFGHLRYDSTVFPEPFEFRVLFINGKVQLNTDPFDGRLSGDGIPTTPELILPKENEIFEHKPQWLDMRWTPSAGIYPIDYEIDIDSGIIASGLSLESPSTGDDLNQRLQRYTSAAPQLTITYRGGWPARWRVRAVNKLGYSDWSEFRTFVFTDE